MQQGSVQQEAQAAPEERTAIVEGLRMHYVHAGVGRPLVLIHGLTGSSHNWRLNLSALAERASVFALDLVNMGQSDRLAGLDAGLAATADRVAAWMDAVGIEAADIAGHSHGGAVSMMLAARHPGRVRSLMLFAPANPYSNLGDRLVRLYSSRPGRIFAQFIPFLPRAIHLLALGRMYGSPERIPPGSLEGYVGGLKIRGTMDHVLEIVRNWHKEMRVLRAALLSLSDLPVLLAWGDRDRAVSVASGERLHAELKRSEWTVVPGAGHVPFEEMPEICNRIMVRWLDRMDLPRYHADSTGRVPAARETSPAASRANILQPSRQA
jgi:pimeloyl-ACP methyl ester carboxylesterase